MNASIKKIASLICLLALISSCHNRIQQTEEPLSHNQPTEAFLTGGKPAPIVAEYVDPNTLAPPVIVPLKGQPGKTLAHPNVYEARKPEVKRIPNNLRSFTIGKNGIPIPKIIPAQGTVLPFKHSKPIPAKAFRTKDAATYNIQYLSDEQGLPANIFGILQDSRGHMWFGSGNAAFRYDGEHFFRYGEEEGLRINTGLGHIMEDRKGNIWLGGGGGIYRYDGREFVKYFEKAHNQPRWGSFMEDREGNIWFFNGDLVKYDGENFAIYDMDYGFEQDKIENRGWFSDGAIFKIMEDRRGHIWIVTRGNGAFRFDGQTFVHLTMEDGLVDNYVGDILEDSQGNIWIGSGGEGTTGRGVSLLKPELSKSTSITGTLSNFNQSHGLSGNRIQEILEDDYGHMWFATYDGGICRYDGSEFTHFGTEEGMSYNQMIHMNMDTEGNLWAGTNGGGISVYKPNSFEHFSKKHGFQDRPTGPRLEDSQGNIWISAWYDGLHKYDGKYFHNYRTENGLLHNHIHNVVEDNKGNVWILYRDKGPTKFDGSSFTHYTEAQGFTSTFYWDIFADNQGLIWVSTGDQGVIRLDPETNRITRFKSPQPMCMGCSSTHQDSQGELWFSSRDHVGKLNKQLDQIEFICQVDTLYDEFTDLMIDDGNGNMWFGGLTNLTQVKENGKIIEDSFPRFTAGKELPAFHITNATYDRDGNLWIASGGKGILCFIDGLKHVGTPDFKWIHYGKADGLKHLNAEGPNSTLIDSKNRLWFGTNGHVTTLDLNTFSLPSDAPNNLNLSHIELEQKFIDYGSLYDESYRSTLAFGKTLSESFDSMSPFQNYPMSFTLPFDLNHITFHFSATDWTAPHNVRYSYKMEGLDNDWSPLSREPKADYRNLPHGKHTFRVKAIGQSNVWSDPLEYSFSILPPWWHTWWAYVIYVLCTVGLVGGYVIRLRRKIRKKQQQLEREQFLNRELRELNVATTRFVPRDFVQILNKENLKELQLGDQTQAEMTVLFADIRDYTSLSEQMSPEENFKFINAYLGYMGPIIQSHGGFICQYFGDGIMALFKDKHQLAVKAAIAMQIELEKHNRRREVQNKVPIQVGIGLNTGQLMLGVIGDEMRYDTSVISDAVNTASRMEGLTKIFGSKVIVSEKTLQQMILEDETDSTIERCRYLGKVQVKGKAKVLKIYDLYGGDTEEVRELKASTKPDFEKALKWYYDKDFGKAADILKDIISVFPDDKATQYYMEKSVKYVIEGVDEKWSGVEEMVSK